MTNIYIFRTTVIYNSSKITFTITNIRYSNHEHMNARLKIPQIYAAGLTS